MKTSFLRSTLLTPLLALAVAGLVACGGGGKAPQTGTLQVKMHDTPVDSAEHVFVTIARVEVFRQEGGAEVKETVMDTPAQFDLLALQNGVSAVLGTGQFPVGDYSSIRLIVQADSKQDIANLPADELGNYIVIDGVAHALVVPSGSQTGIKLNHHFTLTADDITVLTFDFDVRQSVHQRGTQDVFNLRPTLRLIDTVASGHVTGMVSTADASPIPDGTVVSAQQAGVEVASATVDVATGTYDIGPALAGTYDLVVIAPGFGFESETGVVVVAQQTTSGHDFVLTATSTGAIDGTVAVTSTDPLLVDVRLVWNGFLVATTGIDDLTGAYAFASVPVGAYVVTATDGTASASGPATVTAATTTTVDLTLP